MQSLNWKVQSLFKRDLHVMLCIIKLFIKSTSFLPLKVISMRCFSFGVTFAMCVAFKTHTLQSLKKSSQPVSNFSQRHTNYGSVTTDQDYWWPFNENCWSPILKHCYSFKDLTVARLGVLIIYMTFLLYGLVGIYGDFHYKWLWVAE